MAPPDTAPHRSAQTSRPTLRPESQPMTIEQYPVPMAHGHALLVRRTFFPVCMGRGEFRCAVVFSRYARASTTSTRGPGFTATSSTNPFHCCRFVGSLAKADVSPPGRSVGISVLRRANVAVMACASRSHLKPYACASIQILQKSFRPPTALGHPVEEYLSYQSLAWLDRQSPVNRHAYPWWNQ